MGGLSSRNVWRMRMFYVEYKKLPPMVAEISWSHNIIIIEKCKDKNAREFLPRGQSLHLTLYAHHNTNTNQGNSQINN